jgi:hypothetical protein
MYREQGAYGMLGIRICSDETGERSGSTREQRVRLQ